MLDLSTLTTESRNASTEDLDRMSALEIVGVMNQEDRIVPDAIEKVLPQIARTAELAAKAVTDGGRLIYVGAGTSGRLGTLDAAECIPTFGTRDGQVTALMAGGERAFTRAVEGAEDDEEGAVEDLKAIGLCEKDLVVGIAASGRTPYVCAALRYASSVGCPTAAVICNSGSEMSRLADIAIEAVVGPEILTGSTRLKAGTAQKMILNMISTTSMVLCGKVYKNYMVDVLQTNEKLHVRAKNIVMQATGVSGERAEEALRLTGGRAKTAVTMILAGVSPEKAEELLQGSRGHVRRAVSALEG